MTHQVHALHCRPSPAPAFRLLLFFIAEKITHIQLIQVKTQTHFKTHLHSDTHTVEKATPPPSPVSFHHRYSVQLFSFNNKFHNKF